MADSNLEKKVDLTEEELRLVSDPKDIPILTKIKRMSLGEIEGFQEYGPKRKYFSHYNQLQIEWLKTERYLLGTRLQRSPTDEEAAKEYVEHNALRFRVFYVLKYWENVERLDNLP